ncbi:MAG: hypothetical protein NUW22_12625 [Acidobacteria bacterium]|nr:hypothetical protein [Acidobacteriota bacterium]
MSEWWEIAAGTTSTGTQGPVVRQVASQVAALELQSCSVTTAKVAAGNITSESASGNLKQRSVTVAIPSLASCQTGFGSTGYVLWQPRVAVTLQNLAVTPYSDWSFSTSGADSIELWSCASGSAGTWTASSTAVGQIGERLTVTLASTGASIAAGAPVLVNFVTTTCSGKTGGVVQLDYTTTG